MTSGLAKLWRGEIALWVSFWILGVCVVTILPDLLVFLFLMIDLKLPIGSLSTSATFYGIVGGIIFLAYGSLVTVGIWKSASKYQGPKKWSILAKTMAIGFAIFLLYNLISMPHQIEILKRQ